MQSNRRPPNSIRNRVRELRQVRASDLRPHPENWRQHPTHQRRLLSGILGEIGYAGALIARELSDGSLELLDGHLRAETTPDMEVPVLIVDLDDVESRKLLAVLDPISALAEPDPEKLQSLVSDLDFGDESLQQLVETHLQSPDVSQQKEPSPVDLPIPECFQVVAECADESSQQALYERLVQEGYRCRLLML